MRETDMRRNLTHLRVPHQPDLNLRMILSFVSVSTMGGWVRVWSWLLCASAWASGDCAPRLAWAGSPFLEDVAFYLTGQRKDAEKIYEAFKRPATNPYPYPKDAPGVEIPENLDSLWKALGLDRVVFPAGDETRWRKSEDGLWSRRRVVASRAKGRDRMIYRRAGSRGSLSLAQTLEADGKVRETEVAVRRVNSTDRDFFVFDDKGDRVWESVFVSTTGNAVGGPAPLTCLTCHYNPKSREFGLRPRSLPFAEKFALELERLSKEQYPYRASR